MASKHDFILLLDHDMTFPVNTLERLLSHNLPYVSGLYMRRNYSPITPIWFESEEPGELPNRWFLRDIEDDTLYQIGASGWGCVLMHRDVIEKTRAALKGEPDVLEDDLDLYPYDLKRVMGAIGTLGELADNPPARNVILPALRESVSILRDEIKPNRVVRDNVGSDIRFPCYAKLAGVQMHGDSGVRCEHILSYPLSVTDWTAQGAEYVQGIRESVSKAVQADRDRVAAARKALQ